MDEDNMLEIHSVIEVCFVIDINSVMDSSRSSCTCH